MNVYRLQTEVSEMRASLRLFWRRKAFTTSTSGRSCGIAASCRWTYTTARTPLAAPRLMSAAKPLPGGIMHAWVWTLLEKQMRCST